MTSPEETRRRRLNEVASRLQHATGNISYGRTCAWGAMRWGCRFRTMAEYLDVLEEAGLLEIEKEKDLITWVGG